MPQLATRLEDVHRTAASSTTSIVRGCHGEVAPPAPLRFSDVVRSQLDGRLGRIILRIPDTYGLFRSCK